MFPPADAAVVVVVVDPLLMPVVTAFLWHDGEEEESLLSWNDEIIRNIVLGIRTWNKIFILDHLANQKPVKTNWIGLAFIANILLLK